MDAFACFRYTVKADVPEWRNGRRGGLKNRCLTTCEFDSRLGHHSEPEKPASKEVGFFFFKSLRLGTNKGLRLGANSASAALPFSKGGDQLPFEVGFF